MVINFPASKFPETTNIYQYLDSYIFSKLPKTLPKMWVAGGFITQFLKMKKACYDGTDIDIFSSKPQEIIEHVNKSNHIKRENERAIKFRNLSNYKSHLIDIVKLPFSSPEETIKTFDFTVCAIAVDRDGTFFCHEKTFEHIQDRKLVYQNSGRTALYRIEKYIQRGYKLTPELITSVASLIKNGLMCYGCRGKGSFLLFTSSSVCEVCKGKGKLNFLEEEEKLKTSKHSSNP